jgi:hypothetical protein
MRFGTLNVRSFCGVGAIKSVVREGRGVYRVLLGRPEGKRPLDRPRSRWDDNNKTDLKKEIDGTKWTQLAQDKVQWRTFVNTVMKLPVP